VVTTALPVYSYWIYSNTGYFSVTVWRKSHIHIIERNKLYHFSTCRFKWTEIVGGGNLITYVQHLLSPVGLFFWNFQFIGTACFVRVELNIIPCPWSYTG
jgi:hypothetical protein